MQLYHIFFFLIFLSCGVLSYNLYEGNDFGARMSYKEVKKQGIVFFLREETLYYAYPFNTQITGIACVDITPNHLSTATIEEGGIGHAFVKIHLQSARGYGLKYIVEIYTRSFKMDQEEREPKRVNFTN